MKTCVLIPAYNEAKEIDGLIRQVRRLGMPAVVVDDGSLDNTAAIAEAAGAEVIRNKCNTGKGISLSRGFDYILAAGYDTVVMMDGDGQHDPADIPFFLRALENLDCGMIIGNRMPQAQHMPPVRYVTNWFMSWLISSLIGQEVPDSQCGFRLIRREVLERLKLRTRKFEIESEIIIHAARLGFKIKSIPIKTLYRNEKSQINPFIDTLRFIYFIFCEIFHKKALY
jgi:glycosyltransferase involved in cell wall biosynthesis